MPTFYMPAFADAATSIVPPVYHFSSSFRQIYRAHARLDALIIRRASAGE